jgi:hypothetical protein
VSLTSHLKDTHDPLRNWFAEQLPNMKVLLKVMRTSLPEDLDDRTLRPPVGAPPSTLGMAIDYRLRYYLAETPVTALTAFSGARIAARQTGSEGPAAFIRALRSLIAETDPVGHAVRPDLEDRLARACCVLALLEECYRTGQVWPTSLLASIPRKTSADSMLAMIPAPWVADVSAVSRRATVQLDRRLSGAAILNPTFAGSHGVGGADADLVLSGELIDIKATVNPRLDAIWVLQLLGYTMLDWDDECSIDAVGILFARQGVLCAWSLEALLDIGAGPVRPSLQDLRVDFSREVAGLAA